MGPELGFQRVPEPKTVKNRVTFDLCVVDAAAEVERLRALGARRAAGYPEGETTTIMTDSEDNELCVVG